MLSWLPCLRNWHAGSARCARRQCQCSQECGRACSSGTRCASRSLFFWENTRRRRERAREGESARERERTRDTASGRCLASCGACCCCKEQNVFDVYATTRVRLSMALAVGKKQVAVTGSSGGSGAKGRGGEEALTLVNRLHPLQNQRRRRGTRRIGVES
jgi:hypothetical protein